MRELLFILVLVIAIVYWAFYPDQVDSMLGLVAREFQSIKHWVMALL
jgi:hypothetical protein